MLKAHLVHANHIAKGNRIFSKKKKRVFIAMHYLEIGGAETALIGLLQSLDYRRVAVDLFLYARRGEMLQFVPADVRLLPEVKAYTCLECPMTEALKRGQPGVVWGRLRAKLAYRAYCRRKKPQEHSSVFAYVDKYTRPHLPSLRRFGRYDLAISFLAPHGVVLSKVEAKKKVAWIHTDYTRIDTDTALELPVWAGYDRIVSISDDVTRTFSRVFPSLREKIVKIENILSPSFVRHRAGLIPQATIEREMPREPGAYRLLTIGRFSPPKKMEDIPEICRLILAQGLDVRWYIIGYGGDEALVRRRISEAGMEGRVVILGKRDNPYPYILACDLYVQPSRYEGKSVVVREAQVLCKPVVITHYPTAPSQVTDGVDGVIVPLDVPSTADGIARVLRDEALRQQLSRYLVTHDYGNKGEAEKVYALLED